MSADGSFLICQHVAVNICNNRVGVDRQLGLKGGRQRKPNRFNRTYVEDLKDPVEFLPPGGDHILVVLCVEESRSCFSFSLLNGLPLDLGHSPAVRGGDKVTTLHTCCWTNSRSQISDRNDYGLTKFIQLFPFQSPVENLAYFGAE